MWSLSVWSAFVALVPSFAAALTLPSQEAQVRHSGRSISATTQQEIASLVCKNSTITAPTDATWKQATERYMQNIQPHVQLSVRVACESDVAKIVKYANNHNYEFYAVTRGHSLTTSVAQFDGIEIDLGNLQGITISPDKTTAHFQGGVYGNQVINELWEKGFVTATGTCSCVGLLGPGLGGGHGLQQGAHGLTADHFVSLNVVLANGTTTTVNEHTPDLWWAMRGAGHNFGIVTSFESKIWPDNKKLYFVRTYQFARSHLNDLITAMNKFQGNGTLAAPWLGSFGLYTVNETLSTTNASIIWVFLYDGDKADALPDLKPFDALKPLTTVDVNVPYTDLNGLIGGDINGSLCEPNKTHVIGTANLQVYNVTTMTAIYDLYNQKLAQHPELGGTRILVEGYAVKAVKGFPDDGSAYPFRSDNILTYFDVKLNSSTDSRIPFATEWRNQVVNLWNDGQPTRPATTYVNYAAGYETLDARYGPAEWRLTKLRKLKSEYDPNNKFAWYNPIVPPTAGNSSKLRA